MMSMAIITHKIMAGMYASSINKSTMTAAISSKPSTSIVTNMQVGNLTSRHKNTTAIKIDKPDMLAMMGIAGFMFYSDIPERADDTSCEY